MILFEVFNSPYSYRMTSRVDSEDHGKFTYVFSDAVGDEIVVNIEYSFDVDDGSYAQINFRRNDDDISVTNTGDAYRIFATVISIITSFIKDKKPDVIEFTAAKLKYEDIRKVSSTDSRVKLYDRLVNKFAWSFDYSVVISDDGYERVYTLEKR